eukprot:1163739-Pleurochrysis_carterae.AAC.1
MPHGTLIVCKDPTTAGEEEAIAWAGKVKYEVRPAPTKSVKPLGEYAAIKGEVEFKAGQPRAALEIPIYDDDAADGDAVFQ